LLMPKQAFQIFDLACSLTPQNEMMRSFLKNFKIERR